MSPASGPNVRRTNCCATAAARGVELGYGAAVTLFRLELDKEVGVASGGIEVQAARRGAEDFQARDREAAAERAEVCEMCCDLVVRDPWRL